MLNKKADPAVVGYIREHPAHRLQEQKRLMDEHGISRVYSDLALCIRQRRAGHGDVVAVKRLMLLADPKHKRARGGMRQSMRSAVAAIEAAGATILEIDTGRRRDDPAVREEMMLDAIDQLSRTRYGSDKIGRPRRVWSEDQLTIMKLYWFDHRIATNQEAGDAIRAAGVKASNSQIFKAIGPSKRVAGNPRTRQERDGFPSFAEASCGALHTVVDDWNLDDGNIKLCRDSADATKEDRKICEALLSMSLGERYATAIMADDPDFDPEVWRANNEI